MHAATQAQPAGRHGNLAQEVFRQLATESSRVTHRRRPPDFLHATEPRGGIWSQAIAPALWPARLRGPPLLPSHRLGRWVELARRLLRALFQKPAAADSTMADLLPLLVECQKQAGQEIMHRAVV